jgi:Putative peptidoglycan binding domain
MVYRKDEPADAPKRDEFSRDRIQEGLAESNVSTAGFEAFKNSISRQLAARAARLAEESSSLGARSGSAESDTIGNRQNNLEKPGFSSPLFILALGFALGVSAGAGAMYYFQSINLRSLPPSPSVLAASELPSPSATATAPPQTTTATTPLPAVDPMATLQPPSLKEAPSPQPEPVKVDVITSPQPPPSAAAVSVTIAPQSSILPPGRTKLNRPETLEVQTRLESLGMKPGPLDGFFGPLLAAAIRRYEETKGRPQIGNVDRELLERLRQETNESVHQVPPQRSKQP